MAATTAKLLGDIHPLAIHRRNNLVLTLILLGKLEEARQILAANWRLNAPPHANTTPRLAFLRHLIALLESQPDTPPPWSTGCLASTPPHLSRKSRGWPSPHSRGTEQRQRLIRRENRERVFNGLRREHSIERILVKARQLAAAENGGMGERLALELVV